MRKIIFTAAWALSVVSLAAQKEPSGACTHEVGVNGTFLVKNILSLSNFNAEGSPYVFTYRAIWGKTALRAGLAYDFDLTRPEPTVFTVTTTHSVTAFRVGIERRKELGTHWLFFAGIDGFVGRTSFLTRAEGDFDNTSVSDVTTSGGVAPVMGIQFRIGPSISLQTEASMPFSAGNTIHKEESEQFPEINAKTRDNQVTVQSILPTSLFIVINL